MKILSLVHIARELSAFAFGKRRWFRVQGESMRPSLLPGDCVLTAPCLLSSVEPGQIIVFHRSGSSESKEGSALEPILYCVKRLASSTARTFSVKSDNPLDAQDSRHFGSLALSQLVGRGTLVFKKEGHLRLLSPGLAGSTALFSSYS